MPFKSLAQEHYMEAHRSEMERQGVNMSEWEAATKGKKLPKKLKNGKAKLIRNGAVSRKSQKK